jgi:hypothetical protein
MCTVYALSVVRENEYEGLTLLSPFSLLVAYFSFMSDV